MGRPRRRCASYTAGELVTLGPGCTSTSVSAAATPGARNYHRRAANDVPTAVPWPNYRASGSG